MAVRTWISGVIVALALAACSAPESPQELLERAQTSLDNGKANTAMIDIKTALQQEPDNAEARFLFGRAYMMQNDAASAVDEFRRAARGGSVEAEALYARALVAAGRASDLIDFHETSETAPAASGDPTYLAALSRAYTQRGNLEAADEALERAMAAEAESAYLLVTRALFALGDSRETDAAAALLERATANYPEDAEAWSLRADVARLQASSKPPRIITQMPPGKTLPACATG